MVTQRLAEFVVNTPYESIPEDAKLSGKRAILDCLGVTLAGVSDPGSKLVVEFVKSHGGKAESSVIGAGFKTIASEAALANGTMAHILDYDDYCISFLGHPTVAILPAVLALGEREHVSGKDALAAYILGFELGANMGPACGQHYVVGWHCTATLGTVGAVAAACRLLKLTVDQTRMALGIATSLAGGLKQNFGTMTKSLHAGSAARNGVVAGLLAEMGFTANPDILESPQGFCKVFAGGQECDLSKVGEGLGENYIITSSLALKPWPSCAGTHTSIQGALELAEEYNIKAEDVEEVECRTNPFVASAAMHNEPKEGLEGKFSVQYCVSRALLDGEVGLKHFTDEQVNQPEAQALVHKVNFVHPEEMKADFSTPLASEVVIRLKNGTVVAKKVDAPKGEVKNPMTWEDVSTKYRDCASLVLSDKDVDSSLEMVSNLESTSDIASLMEILTSKGKKKKK